MTYSKEVAILGSSCNPPHVGHRLMVEYLLKKLNTEVWIMPTFRHSFPKELINFKHRFNMANLNIKGLKNVFVSDVEEKIGGVSYTLNTVKELMKIYPDYRFKLVISSEIANQLEEWKNYEELEKMIEFIIFPRKGIKIKHFPLRYIYLKDVSIPDISSSMIVEKLKKGLSVDKFLTKDVLVYIKKHSLYT